MALLSIPRVRGEAYDLRVRPARPDGGYDGILDRGIPQVTPSAWAEETDNGVLVARDHC